MAALARLYPRWLSSPTVVGHSREGRPLHVYCLAAELEGCDGRGSRPAVVYTSLVHAREPQRVWELAKYAAGQWRRTDERAQLCMPDFSHESGANARAGVRELEEDPAFRTPPDTWHT